MCPWLHVLCPDGFLNKCTENFYYFHTFTNRMLYIVKKHAWFIYLYECEWLIWKNIYMLRCICDNTPIQGPPERT